MPDLLLFHQSCEEPLFAFLKSSVPKGADTEDAAIEADSSAAIEKEGVTDEELSFLATAILDAERVLTDIPTVTTSLATFVRALVLLRFRAPSFTPEREKLGDSFAGQLLDQYRDQLHASASSGLRELGFVDVQSEVDVDLRSIELIAECKHVVAGGHSAFLTPIATWDGRALNQHLESQYEKLFPNNGEVFATSQTPGVRVPEKGEVGIWRVEIYTTDKPVKARVRRSSTTLFEVIRLPVVSTDHDSVRDALGTISEGYPARVIFETLDKLLIRPRKRVPELIRDRYSEPFDGWRELKGFAWKGKRYAICAAGDAELLYDCAEPEIFLGRLLALEAKLEGQPRLTRTQIRDITNAVRDTRQSIDLARMEGLTRTMDRYLATAELVSAVTGMLLQEPRIKEAIEKATQQAVLSAVDHKKELGADIKKLEERRAALAAELRAWEVEQRKLPGQLAQSIRVAFEKAKGDGLRTIAEATVMQALSGALNTSLPASPEPAQSSWSGTSSPWDLTWTNVSPTSKQSTKDVLQRFGVYPERIEPVAKALEIAVRAGMIIAVTGTASSAAITPIAQSLNEGGLWITKVGIGASDSAATSARLKDSLDSGRGIVFVNANFSDIETYAVSAIEHVLERLSSRGNQPKPLIAISVADGPSALPLSPTLRSVCLSVALDAQSALPAIATLADVLDQIEGLEKETGTRVWRPVLKLMMLKFEELSPADLALAAPVFLESVRASMPFKN